MKELILQAWNSSKDAFRTQLNMYDDASSQNSSIVDVQLGSNTPQSSTVWVY